MELISTWHRYTALPARINDGVDVDGIFTNHDIIQLDVSTALYPLF